MLPRSDSTTWQFHLHWSCRLLESFCIPSSRVMFLKLINPWPSIRSSQSAPLIVCRRLLQGDKQSTWTPTTFSWIWYNVNEQLVESQFTFFDQVSPCCGEIYGKLDNYYSILPQCSAINQTNYARAMKEKKIVEHWSKEKRNCKQIRFVSFFSGLTVNTTVVCRMEKIVTQIY